MKKYLLLILLVFTLSLFTPSFGFAQGMMGDMVGGNNTVSQSDDDHTAYEEAEGKEIWEKLQAKAVTCDDLSDDDFAALGEYFMGQMMGDSHEAMNNRLIQTMGKKGEEQMHRAMGKRMSNCEPNAPMPQNMPAPSGVEGMGGGMPAMNPSEARGSWMPMMMNMMLAPWRSFTGIRGGGNQMMGYWGNNIMGGWGVFGILGLISMLLFWLLIILGVIALVRYLGGFGKTIRPEKTPLDILKQRYAKGEIDKKEFEEKKKDLK